MDGADVDVHDADDDSDAQKNCLLSISIRMTMISENAPVGQVFGIQHATCLAELPRRYLAGYLAWPNKNFGGRPIFALPQAKPCPKT